MEEAMDEAQETLELPLRQELSCVVCTRLYEDPQMLPCAHSFCRECLDKSYRVIRVRRCPLCKTEFAEGDPIANRALNSACEAFRCSSEWLRGGKAPGDDICKLHLKPLGLFCEKDEEPLCVDCVTQHQTHQLWSQREGLSLCKNDLNLKVDILEKKLYSYKKMTQRLKSTTEYIKFQAGEAEKQIKAEFERLRQVLAAEETKRLSEIDAEKEQKVAKIEMLISKTKEDMVSLDDLIKSVKRDMGCEDLTLLLNFKELKKRAQWIQGDPGIPDDSLLNMGKHVGSLSFKIWRELQSCVKYNPVVLDPNTTNPRLSLSDDLTSMKESTELLTVPDNPERFDPCVFVLGAEGYTSGKHKWEVLVGENPKWIVGVCKESVARKRKFTLSTNRGIWSVCYSKGDYVASTPERTKLQVQSRLKRIRVKLNMDKGEVSFWDGENDNHLITFTHKFNEKIFPIFGPGLCSEPMTLVEGKYSCGHVMKDQHRD